MNHNLLRRRQLLFYFGLGVVGMGATTIAFPSLTKLNTPSDTVANPNNTPASEIAVKPATAKSLPEFQGISQWLNSAPLSIADLKGNVVLVQFWTFGCINCQRTLPYITKWHQQYAAQGLKVIGIHTPEFAFERDTNNIKKALRQHQITYPVPIDNEYKTWNAYENQYWPHLFLADRQGLLRYDHIGEGAYEKIEQTIRQLLG
ncbi:MAG: thioredoxin family protein [Desmonostoc geniculatum HA4340-LM1]|jgi:thiol-disulfide isomerase/thioredoxin|nr:thioredoxin family protein [Desmonostoc geniculatum HA4340-LM1]